MVASTNTSTLPMTFSFSPALRRPVRSLRRLQGGLAGIGLVLVGLPPVSVAFSRGAPLFGRVPRTGPVSAPR
jgi:hypothetical protein